MFILLKQFWICVFNKKWKKFRLLKLSRRQSKWRTLIRPFRHKSQTIRQAMYLMAKYLSQFHQRFTRAFFVRNCSWIFGAKISKPKSQLRSFWHQNFVWKTREKNVGEINNFENISLSPTVMSYWQVAKVTKHLFCGKFTVKVASSLLFI